MSVCYDGGVSWVRMGCAETVLDVYCNYSRMDMNLILYVVPRCVCVLCSALVLIYELCCWYFLYGYKGGMDVCSMMFICVCVCCTMMYVCLYLCCFAVDNGLQNIYIFLYALYV